MLLGIDFRQEISTLSGPFENDSTKAGDNAVLISEWNNRTEARSDDRLLESNRINDK